MNHLFEDLDWLDSDTKATGVVRWYNPQSGYGFIESDAQEDIFCHYRHLADAEFVRRGDRVEFDIADTSRGPQARNVVIVGRSQQAIVQGLDLIGRLLVEANTFIEIEFRPEAERPFRVTLCKNSNSATGEGANLRDAYELAAQNLENSHAD